MITSLSSTNPVLGARPSRPQQSGAGEEPAVQAPTDQVTVQSAPVARPQQGWLKSKLATVALTVGLTAAALGTFTAPAMAHDGWGHHRHHQPPAATCQVQTGSQFGIGVDQNGNLGVYFGSQSYNRCNGTHERGGVSIGPNGVGVEYGVSGPGGWGFGPNSVPGGHPNRQQVIINQGGQVIINQGGYGW